MNLRFPGAINDASGLLHIGQRDHNTTLGQWMEADPIGLAGSFPGYPYASNNPYPYAGNNPITNIDPDGRQLEVSAQLAYLVLKEVRYNRNTIFNNQTPGTLANAELTWTELYPEQSIYHTMGASENTFNRKFISPNGGHSEAIFTANGVPVTDSLNGPSYNLFDPVNDSWLHAQFDVAPYMLWGNSPKDEYDLNRWDVTARLFADDIYRQLSGLDNLNNAPNPSSASSGDPCLVKQ